MHFEILVEDLSGKKMLDVLVPKVVGPEHTVRVIPYKGVGRVPRDLGHDRDPSKRILLDQLPRLLRGYGRTFSTGAEGYPCAVIVVCDLDDKCLKAFRHELDALLNGCFPKPATRFCIAIEEGEAWFLGDLPALKGAYPGAKDAVLRTYVQDSICGTWERLADAVYPGGTRKLKSLGWQVVGAEKSRWAEVIAPRMDVDRNTSPSFHYFVGKLRELTAAA